ncbi:hypothetical protein MCO_00213 [Bartonella sp. DB5-6]|uniref:hypothetical protein n=1 Tax=Bartonella sp. DB5-6 TaxID=1094755 RepID=UPI00026E912C|nr:hypothetical protein [Bartonella sp. DB5-6]EJF80699.1 hypothetical protein MCO_00213 [Bartonella sp. DB5-6]
METLTINSGANSFTYSGTVLQGQVKIDGLGRLHFYARSGEHRTKAEEIILKEKEAKLYSIAPEVDG